LATLKKAPKEKGGNTEVNAQPDPVPGRPASVSRGGDDEGRKGQDQGTHEQNGIMGASRDEGSLRRDPASSWRTRRKSTALRNGIPTAQANG
jgi:hypothetical protein